MVRTSLVPRPHPSPRVWPGNEARGGVWPGNKARGGVWLGNEARGGVWPGNEASYEPGNDSRFFPLSL